MTINIKLTLLSRFLWFAMGAVLCVTDHPIWMTVAMFCAAEAVVETP